jgi:hypothetical protein
MVALSVSFVAFGMLGQPAGGAPTPEARIVITSITSVIDSTEVPVAVADHPFSVGVALVDQSGDPSLATRDTRISLGASGGSANLGGNTSGTILRNTSSTTISGVTYPEVENVVLSASGFRLETGTTLLSVQEIAVPFSQPAGTPVTASTCSEATLGNKCVIVDGSNGGEGFVAQASCDDFPGAEQTVQCLTNDSLISVIGDLKDLTGQPLYTATSPLVVTVLCDKLDCKEKARPSSGVPFVRVFYQAEESGPFVQLNDCVVKGVVNAGEDACVDFKSSSRTSAGDLELKVLLTLDPRFH